MTTTRNFWAAVDGVVTYETDCKPDTSPTRWNTDSYEITLRIGEELFEKRVDAIKAARAQIASTIDCMNARAKDIDDLEVTPEEPPTWETTLDCKHFRYGVIDKMSAMAKETGYPFYAWNGRVYVTGTGKEIGTLGEYKLRKDS